MKLRLLSLLQLLWFVSIASAQEIVPPIPQRLDIHSNILKEDRVVWVRTPPGYQKSKDVYPVLYQTDAPGHVNEIGSTIDFLVNNNRMPPLIVVGIANTDRTRDLTPTHADFKNPDGTVNALPTSGGADRFLDFIQTELMPEIEKRYRTAPYRIFAGHSLGGLLAIHTLITRPDLFSAYIAVSPSLQWDDGHTLHQAQQFFATHAELRKALFFSLANEDTPPNPMGENFEQLRKTLAAGAPKGLIWDSARYPDEDHGSTVLRAHYAGLRTIFSDWQVPRGENGLPAGGLAGLQPAPLGLATKTKASALFPALCVLVLSVDLNSIRVFKLPSTAVRQQMLSIRSTPSGEALPSSFASIRQLRAATFWLEIPRFDFNHWVLILL